jgi:hypothetical protein
LDWNFWRKCRGNTYGINCEKNCSDNCLNRRCRNTDGMCLRCPPGYQGFNCTTGTLSETISQTAVVEVHGVHEHYDFNCTIGTLSETRGRTAMLGEHGLHWH